MHPSHYGAVIESVTVTRNDAVIFCGITKGPDDGFKSNTRGDAAFGTSRLEVKLRSECLQFCGTKQFALFMSARETFQTVEGFLCINSLVIIMAGLPRNSPDRVP